MGEESTKKTIENNLKNTINPGLSAAELGVNTSKVALDKYEAENKAALDEIDKEIADCQTALDAAAGKIRDVIDKTNVGESDVPQFLNLINDGLLFSTMKGQMERDKMGAKLAVFSTLIQRSCSAKLQIA